VGVPESLHHLLSGVRARSITLTADDLVLGGQSQFSGQVVFGLSAAGVDALVLVLAVAEEGKDQSFIFLDFFLSLEFADEGLAALQSVHGPDESKKSILIGADGGNLSVSGITPLVFAVAFFLLTAEAEEREAVWVFLPGEVQPHRATVLEDTPEEAEVVLLEYWDGDTPPERVERCLVRRMWG